MPHTDDFTLEGGCTCGAVKYRMTRAPFIVHGCHCTWCQRETGSAFAVNALVESTHVEVLAGAPETILTPSASGKGQKIVRCPTCRIAVWSHYSGFGKAVSFIRTGTLNGPHTIAPDVHIFTSTKRPWVILPEGVPAVPEFYDPKEIWTAETMKRVKALKRG